MKICSEYNVTVSAISYEDAIPYDDSVTYYSQTMYVRQAANPLM